MSDSHPRIMAWLENQTRVNACGLGLWLRARWVWGAVAILGFGGVWGFEDLRNYGDFELWRTMAILG